MRYRNTLHKAEGTIAKSTGGRKTWDASALREFAIRALKGEEYRPSGSDSPEEYRAKARAFKTIADRTSDSQRAYFLSRMD